jgi:hypothetical protein
LELKKLQIYSGYWLYVTAIPKRTQVSVRVYGSGYVTVVAVGQSKRFYFGAGIFNWY